MGGIAAHNEFGKPRLKKTSLDNFDIVAHFKRFGGDTTHLDIGVSVQILVEKPQDDSWYVFQTLSAPQYCLASLVGQREA